MCVSWFVDVICVVCDVYTPMHTGPRRAHGHAHRVCMWNARSNGLQTRANRTHAAWAMQCVRIDWHVKTNEQKSQAQGSSEPGRRGTSKATRADRVHTAAVVGERANSGQRGRVCYICGPIGFRTSTRDVEAQSAAKEHTSEARGDDRGPGVRHWSR